MSRLNLAAMNGENFNYFTDDPLDIKPNRCVALTCGFLDYFVKTPISSLYNVCRTGLGKLRTGLEKLQKVLEDHPYVDRGLVGVCAGASGVIAWSSPAALGALVPFVTPWVIPGIGGNIVAVIFSLIANIALLLGFKLSNNIKLTLRARDRINKMEGAPYWIMEVIWFYLLVNYLAESIAQGELTAANFEGGWLQVIFWALGWAGFTLSRSAAIARILFALIFPSDPKDVYKPCDLYGRRYDDQPIDLRKKIQTLLGRKPELSTDEQIMDIFGSMVTFTVGILCAVVVYGNGNDLGMYSLKLLKGLQRIHIDVCSGDSDCKNVSPAIVGMAKGLSSLNFLFFPLTFQDSAQHIYQYIKSTNNYGRHKNVPQFVTWSGISFSFVVLLTVGRGSIGGLLTPGARGPADLTTTTVLMMFVNTIPLLKELAKCTKGRISDTGNAVRDIKDISQLPHVRGVFSNYPICCLFVNTGRGEFSINYQAVDLYAGERLIYDISPPTETGASM